MARDIFIKDLPIASYEQVKKHLAEGYTFAAEIRHEDRPNSFMQTDIKTIIEAATEITKGNYYGIII